MNVPQAKIVHDKFHIAKYLGEAVDKVRPAEHRELKQAGESPLAGIRQLLLYNEENLDEDDYLEVLTIQRVDLKTGRVGDQGELSSLLDLLNPGLGSTFL